MDTAPGYVTGTFGYASPAPTFTISDPTSVTPWTDFLLEVSLPPTQNRCWTPHLHPFLLEISHRFRSFHL